MLFRSSLSLSLTLLFLSTSLSLLTPSSFLFSFALTLSPPHSTPSSHSVFLVEEVVTLARSTREGGLSVLDFLLRHRLSAANAFSPGGGGGSAGAAAARRKALRLVTAICSRGPSDFKREAARSASGAIR